MASFKGISWDSVTYLTLLYDIMAWAGIDCVPTVNLPTNCFCRGHGGRRAASVGAVVPLSDLLRAVEKAGTDFQQTEESGGR